MDNIIRIGSAGALTPKLKLRDVVMAQAVCTDSNYGHQFNLPGFFRPPSRISSCWRPLWRWLGAWAWSPPVGNLLSSDVFYDKSGRTLEWGAMGVPAAEMETAALYYNAAEAGKRALTICTISDSMVTGEALPAADRQTSFTQMMEIALETAVEMAKKA